MNELFKLEIEFGWLSQERQADNLFAVKLAFFSDQFSPAKMKY